MVARPLLVAWRDLAPKNFRFGTKCFYTCIHDIVQSTCFNATFDYTKKCNATHKFPQPKDIRSKISKLIGEVH